MEVTIQLYTVRKGHNKMYLYSKDTIIANSGLCRRGTDTKEPLILPCLLLQDARVDQH